MPLNTPLPALPQCPSADPLVLEWANQVMATIQNWARKMTAQTNQNFNGAVEVGRPHGGMPAQSGTLNAQALLVMGLPVLTSIATPSGGTITAISGGTLTNGTLYVV